MKKLRFQLKNNVVILSSINWLYNSQAKLTDEQVSKLKETRKVCTEESGVDTATLDAAKKGQFADDDKFKAYLLCAGKKIGFIDAAGEPQHAVIKSKLGAAIDDQDLADKLDAECAVKKNSPEETAFEIVKCSYEKSPKHDFIY